MNFFEQLPDKLRKKTKKNVSLAQFSSFKIGGPASFFITLDESEDIIKTIQLAKKNQLPYLILGGGSNILVSDQGFSGLAIKIACRTVNRKADKIISDAGADLSQVILFAKKNYLSGLEFLVGIPGTIGGAVRGNAGAFGQAIGQVVQEVLVVNEAGEKEKLSSKECRFGYRDSVFKSSRSQNVILKATLKLAKGSSGNITRKMQENLKKRPKCGWPSAGCIFKNPDLPYSVDELKKKGLNPEKITPHGKISAGYLIDQLDLKGKRIGGAMVARQNANYIINIDNATAEDVVILIGIIKQKVRNNYGIQLQEEVQYIGF